MRDPAIYRRRAAAVCLVLAGALSAVFTLLAAAPGWGSDDVERLQAIVEAGDRASLSFMAFALYQGPLAVGLLGVAHLVRGRAPILSSLGATFAVAGAFGYAVYGGAQLLIPAMAADPANLEVFAQLRSDAEPLTGPFGAVGMVGFVVGLVLLSIGLWRARVGQRWIAVAAWVFVVVEFVGTSITPAASFVSAALLTALLVGLGVLVWRSPAAAWVAGVDAVPAALTEPRVAAPR